MDNCHLCSRELDSSSDPLSRNLGGDCQMCMAEAGDDFALQHLWVFSFGFSQTHAFEGMTLDKNTCLGIVGDCSATRDKMFELFGPVWSMQYRFDDYSPKYFNKGIVKWIRA